MEDVKAGLISTLRNGYLEVSLLFFIFFQTSCMELLQPPISRPWFVLRQNDVNTIPKEKLQ